MACRDLWLGYASPPDLSRAIVKGVSFDVQTRETLAIVGESGSGKTTLAKALVKLLPVWSGTLHLRGKDITQADAAGFFPFRQFVQLIFQDPWKALNPRRPLQELLAEPLLLHKPELGHKDRSRRINELLDQVQLPKNARGKYPSEFSGGQRQRILIARALAVEPELLICDEPVSALDVSTQAALLRLLAHLQGAFGLSLIFISHDLAVVQQIAERVLVMRKGKVVEAGETSTLFRHPEHAYTRLLLESCPVW